MDEVTDKMDTKMDHSDTGACESVAEWNDMVMEEWHQTVMHQLPHETTPKVMIEGLMKETIERSNMFPAFSVEAHHLGNQNCNAMSICDIHWVNTFGQDY